MARVYNCIVETMTNCKRGMSEEQRRMMWRALLLLLKWKQWVYFEKHVLSEWKSDFDGERRDDSNEVLLFDEAMPTIHNSWTFVHSSSVTF